jgi:hypothetical protein
MDFQHIWIKIIVTKVEKELLYASFYNFCPQHASKWLPFCIRRTLRRRKVIKGKSAKAKCRNKSKGQLEHIGEANDMK